MAVVTDQLVTILRLTGATEYANGLRTASTAARQFGAASKTAGIGGGGGAGGIAGAAGAAAPTTAGGITGALAGISVTAVEVAGAFALLGVGIVDAVRAFGEAEQVIFATTVVLKNLHSSLSIGDVQGFAKELQHVSGVQDETIVSSIGLLKRFGATDEAVKGLTGSALDLAAITGGDLNRAVLAIGHAVVGRTQMLKNMGIEFTKTGDRAKDFAAIQEAINNVAGGAANARLNTLTGALQGLGSALQDLLVAVGSRIATVLVPIIHALTAVVQFFADHVALFTAAVGANLGSVFGPIGAIIGGLVGLGIGLLPQKGNAAEGIGTGKGKLATEDTLQEIAANTSKLDDLVKAVFGEAGTAARTGFSLRDARLAFNV